jgi:cell division protein FtsQ
MGRQPNPEREPRQRPWRIGLRYALYSAAILLLAVAALYLYSRVDEFLAADPRFRLAEPPADGGENPALRIEGVVHASRDKILNAFSADYGRSIYLLPLAERRRTLLAIDWVKDASLSRLWPDRVAVRIVERTPVAFVQIPEAGIAESRRVALIDAEGVILEQPLRAHFTLPVLVGIRREQSQPMRRLRVATALRLVQELGSLAGQLSEIDVSDAGNVKVVREAQGRVLLLLLGNRNFLLRLQNFISHYPEIQQRLPNAATFDLRLDDRITALGEDARGD